ncbi:hypothetical protein WN944_005465 [Citrus x changshan-huyou]|uniref:endo-polygalacturonase n=1 Tax=Citrus x changshan-huyou TaxID=2935761 RepID=A0AAP0QJM9_9ROSI|nr:probable polygalacturonase At1g80170 [Citrus x clementina]
MANYVAVLFLLLSTQCFLSAHCRHLPSNQGAIGDVFDVLNYGAAGDGHTDDTQAFKDAWKATCKSSSSSPTMHVPHDKSFKLQPLTFSGEICKSNSITFQIDGHLVAPRDPHAWNTCDGSKCRQWIQFKKFGGLFIRGVGSINGQGSNWWKLSCKHDKIVCGKKPTGLVVANSNNVHIDDLTFEDSPQMHIAFERSTNIEATNLTIMAPGNSPNTDGIHIQHSSNVSIAHSIISTGDDCVSIGDGSSHLNITNIFCGPGHGISIGSLGMKGRNEKVEFVHVNNVSFTETQNGVRIKTWQGGKGYARHIVFENIIFQGSYNPIVIDQYYCPHKHCKNKTLAVKISDVTYNHILGTSNGETAVAFSCSTSTPCKNIIMKDIHLGHVKPEKKTSSYCSNVRGTADPGVFPKVSCLQVDENV